MPVLVLVALAMGASRVVAAGRNEQVLNDLATVDPRIRPVQLCGDREADTGAMREAATIGTATGAHALVDAVGLTDTTEHVLAGLDALAPGGTAVLAGGVSAAIPLDYQVLLGRQLTVRGSFMTPTTALIDLVAMTASGTLRLDVLRPHVFPLADVALAVDAAAEGRGLDYTIVMP